MARYEDNGLDSLIGTSEDDFQRWGDGVAQEITDDVKLKFGTGAAGRSYKRGATLHVASAPGYPPNVDTGALRVSMRWVRVNSSVRHIQDGVEYGYPLEMGTTKMDPRPFMGPVIEEWKQRKLMDSADSFRLVR